MNSRDLIDQTTGRILPSQVKAAARGRAAFLIENGWDRREAILNGLRMWRGHAKSERDMWEYLNDGKPKFMVIPDLDGVSHEWSV